jgi:hypothetical protein
MTLLAALVTFAVGLLSGVVVGRVAGLVALALVPLGVTSVQLSFVDYVVREFSPGNELLFLPGFLLGIDARRARTVVVGRGRRD